MRTKRTYIIPLIALLALLSFTKLSAQKSDLSKSAIFKSSESFEYKVSFKWGIIRGKVGEAKLTNSKASNGSQYFSQLHFRTTGLGDTFYRMRDTLETLYSAQKLPLRYEKRVEEKGFIQRDEVSFSYSGNKVNATSRVVRPSEVLLDTLYVFDSSEYQVIDLLSTLALVRTYNPSEVTSVPTKRVAIPSGHDIVYLEYEFRGTDSVKMPDGSTSEAMIIDLNINDEAFKKKSSSVQVWLTRDEQQIPVKIHAELSVGYVVVELVSYNIR